MNLKTLYSSKRLKAFVVFLFSLSLLAGNVYAADPVFNSMGNDLETLTLENRTTNPNAEQPGGANWRDPITASGGNAVSFRFYYHNTVVGSTATNTRLRIYYPGAASTTLTMTGSIISDNAPQVNDTGTINVSSSQSITFENTAYWYPNQTTTNPISLNVTNTGTYVEVNIGSVAGGWPTQGNVVFRANLSNNPAPGAGSPSVDAGPNQDIGESQSVVLSGSASDPQNDPMTYSWSCNGGSLSSSTILNPTYFAPSVSSDMTYSCTLTATDNNGNSGSDSVSIIVRNTDGSSGGSGFSGGGGPTINVSLSANPATGLSPLNGVDLTANVSTSGISNDRLIIYRFDCENNNSWELRVETTKRSYTAQDLCNYYYDGTYTVKVDVESAGYTASNQINLVVGTLPGGGAYGISVDAGSNKEIGENQSTILNGYAYSQYGYSLGYYWSCNGGSLSNSNTLSPTYYAPSVNYDTTYTCTLFVTDGRGYKNSDSANIIVRDTGSATGTGLKVTTNFAESVASNSAVLKGTLNNDGGQYTSVRFNWGRLTSYNNFTSWVSGKTTGQTFSQYISGLEKGKAYHYRVEASNGREIVVGQDITFLTKPDATTGFVATGVSSNQINLSWTPGVSSCYTLITRKTGGYPANSADGTVVYYGSGNSFVDRNLSNNVWYYYRVWAVGCDEGLYSFSDSQYSRAYTVATTGYIAPITEEKTETGISLEVLARDMTQNEIAWQNSIITNPDDEIEFKVVIAPTGGRSLENVVLKSALSDKITSINGVKVDDEAYNGQIDGEVNLGTVALGETKTITFKGKIAGKDNFSYGSNELTNSVEVSAKDISSVKKDLNISVSRSVEAGAGLISFIDWRVYSGILTFLFVVVSLVMMWLLIDRKRGKEYLTEKAGSTKVEKSKYFNIK
jgi:hypothetical protein